jgi:hypothetical protein
MKKNNQEPVQVMLTYKANSSEKDKLRAKVVTTTVTKKENKLTRLDDNHKLVRRYSFDDNGGGYLGL